MRPSALLPRRDTGRHACLPVSQVNSKCRARAATHRWYLMTCDQGRPSAMLSCTTQEMSCRHQFLYRQQQGSRSSMPNVEAAKHMFSLTHKALQPAHPGIVSARPEEQPVCKTAGLQACFLRSFLSSFKTSTTCTEVLMSQEHSAHLPACRCSQAALTRTGAGTGAPR
jgi:hypothetical protein